MIDHNSIVATKGSDIVNNSFQDSEFMGASAEEQRESLDRKPSKCPRPLTRM